MDREKGVTIRVLETTTRQSEEKVDKIAIMPNHTKNFGFYSI
jgi:hypothetical protein